MCIFPLFHPQRPEQQCFYGVAEQHYLWDEKVMEGVGRIREKHENPNDYRTWQGCTHTRESCVAQNVVLHCDEDEEVVKFEIRGVGSQIMGSLSQGRVLFASKCNSSFNNITRCMFY